MKKLSIIGVLLYTAFMINIAHAKEQKHSQHMDHRAMMELYQKLATPSEAHKLLASLEGSWTTKTEEWIDPGKPPMESTGSVEMKMLLDGRYLQQEYQGIMMGQPFTGISINAYDNLTQQYVTIWMSTTGTSIFIMKGSASKDGKIITLSGKHPEPGGGFMSHRAVWKIADSNNQTFEMFGNHQGGKEMKMMKIIYTRK
jgi:hypothetical protein